MTGRDGRIWVGTVIALAAFAAGVTITIVFSNSSGGQSKEVEPERGGGAAPARVAALGRIQPAGGVIPVFGPPGDRIQSMKPLAPGTVLKSGDPIATLASREQREGDVKIAEVQLREAKNALKAAQEAGQKKILAAQAELNQLTSGEESDLRALGAKIGFVEKSKAAAVAFLERLVKLKADMVRVADEDMEKAKLAVDQADAELTAAKAAKDKAVSAYAENKKAAKARLDAAKADLDESVAKAPIQSSEEKLTQAKKLLDLTILKAPIDGTVLKVGGRDGQPTGVEPVLHMADLNEMTVVAEVYESDVERVAGWVRAGPAQAEATNAALPKPLKGSVRSDRDISRMIARNQVLPVGPREDADRRVVEVTAVLDAESAAIAARYVGLQVTVVIGK